MKAMSPVFRLPLSSVLYVPHFYINLLSFGQITKAPSCSVTFFTTYYVFHDHSMKKMIGNGCLVIGFYQLDQLPPKVVAYHASNEMFQ